MDIFLKTIREHIRGNETLRTALVYKLGELFNIKVRVRHFKKTYYSSKKQIINIDLVEIHNLQAFYKEEYEKRGFNICHLLIQCFLHEYAHHLQTKKWGLLKLKSYYDGFYNAENSFELSEFYEKYIYLYPEVVADRYAQRYYKKVLMKLEELGIQYLV